MSEWDKFNILVVSEEFYDVYNSDNFEQLKIMILDKVFDLLQSERQERN